jgi:ABC-type multidrug transport system ATPase subunit
MIAIAASGLAKRFGEVRAVGDVSFEVGEGEVFGFLGPTAPARPPPSTC